MSRQAGVGSRKSRKTSEENWVKIPNTFDAIISEMDYNKSQEMITNAKKISREGKHEKHPLVGYIICGDCGRKMKHINQGRSKFYCGTRYLNQSKKTCKFNLFDADIEKIVLELLQEQLMLYIDTKSVITKLKKKQNEKVTDATKRLNDMEKSLEMAEADLRAAYESYREKITGKDTYLAQRTMYEKITAMLQENIKKQQSDIDQLELTEELYIPDFEKLDNQLKLNKLTREMVETFIEEIVVYGEKEVEVKCGSLGRR